MLWHRAEEVSEMPFQYHVREMTAETSAEDFVTHFVHVEKFLPFC